MAARVGLGERVQQLEHGAGRSRSCPRPAEVAGSSRSRRVAVVGEQQVLAHQRRDRPRRRPGEAHPRRRSGRRSARRPRCGRPAGPCRCRAAARRASSRSGRATSRVSVGGGDGGLDQVPVDGEPVPRGGAGAAADPLPLGQQPLEQPVLVERLQHRRRRRGPLASSRRNDHAQLRRPRLGQRRAVHREHPQRGRRERQVGARGGRAAAAQQQPGRPPGRAPRARTTSSSCWTTPSAQRLGASATAAGRARAGGGRSAASTRRQVRRRRRRAGARRGSSGAAAGPRRCSRAPRRPRRCSWRTRTSVARPVCARCSASRTSSSGAYGGLGLGRRLRRPAGRPRAARSTLPRRAARRGLLEVGLEQEARARRPRVPRCAAQLAQLAAARCGAAAATGAGRRRAGPRARCGVAGDVARVEQAEQRP